MVGWKQRRDAALAKEERVASPTHGLGSRRENMIVLLNIFTV